MLLSWKSFDRSPAHLSFPSFSVLSFANDCRVRSYFGSQYVVLNTAARFIACKVRILTECLCRASSIAHSSAPAALEVKISTRQSTTHQCTETVISPGFVMLESSPEIIDNRKNAATVQGYIVERQTVSSISPFTPPLLLTFSATRRPIWMRLSGATASESTRRELSKGVPAALHWREQPWWER